LFNKNSQQAYKVLQPVCGKPLAEEMLREDNDPERGIATVF
jgi:hypothetical protein